MRPNAPMFSPSPAVASPPPNGEHAVVPYLGRTDADGGAAYSTADAFKSKQPGATPRELILHESIRHLVSEVVDLQTRCEGLEASNGQLHKSLQAMEKAFCDQAMKMPLTKANLAGYAPSEDSSDGDTASLPNVAIEQRLNTITLILENYSQRFEAQAEQLVKQDEIIQEFTTYKDSQALFVALNSEFSELNTTSTVQQASGSESTESLEARLDASERKLLQQLADVESKLAACTTAKVDTTATSVTEQRIEAVEQSLKLLKFDHKRMTRRLKQEQIIDDASTKETLYRHFADIDSILIDDDGQRRCGSFQGTFADLWPLRDRIICRLALFDRYSAAFKEAQKGARDFT